MSFLPNYFHSFQIIAISKICHPIPEGRENWSAEPAIFANKFKKSNNQLYVNVLQIFSYYKWVKINHLPLKILKSQQGSSLVVPNPWSSPSLGSPLNPILTKGADYAHRITVNRQICFCFLLSLRVAI